MSVGSPSSTPTVAGYKWVRDDVLKYKSCLTSTVTVVALQRPVKLVNAEDSYKLVIQACGSDDFLNLRAAPSCPPFFFYVQMLVQGFGCDSFCH